jgi:hypothetical protein
MRVPGNQKPQFCAGLPQFNAFGTGPGPARPGLFSGIPHSVRASCHAIIGRWQTI